METQKRSIKDYYPILLIIILTILFVSSLVQSYRQGGKLVEHHAAQVHSLMTIRHESALAHLWIEEIIAGDRQSDTAQIWMFLDHCIFHATALVEGGKIHTEALPAIDDPELADMIIEMGARLDEFRQIAKIRLNSRNTSGIGSEIDQEFDGIFDTFQSQAVKVEEQLLERLQAELKSYRALQQLQAVAVILAGLVIGIIFQFLRARRQKDIRLLQRSEQKHRGIIQNLMEGFFSTTLDGILIDHNAELARIFGVDPDQDHSGTDVTKFWQFPEEREVYEQEFGAKGYLKNYAIRARKVDGTEIIAQINSRLIYNDEGRPIRIEGTLLDITDRMMATRALKDSERLLKESQERAHRGS